MDKEELLYWLILDEVRKQFSDAIDILAVASMLVSLPVIPVSGKLGAGTAQEGRARCHWQAEPCLNSDLKKGRRTITWAKMLQGEWAYTTNVGAYIGRWLPWVRAALTACDLAMITRNVIPRYRLIVG